MLKSKRLLKIHRQLVYGLWKFIENIQTFFFRISYLVGTLERKLWNYEDDLFWQIWKTCSVCDGQSKHWNSEEDIWKDCLACKGEGIIEYA